MSEPTKAQLLAEVEALRKALERSEAKVARLSNELQYKNDSLTEAQAQTTEALEQQAATSEILRVISSSPTDVQPVFDALVESARRLCGAERAFVNRFDGEFLRVVATHNARPAVRE